MPRTTPTLEAADPLGGGVLGRGLYAPAEAARLIGMPAGTLGSWFREGAADRSPLLHRDYAGVLEGPTLSFLDLVEALVAHRLRAHGLSTQQVRRAHAALAGFFATDRPFAHRGFYVDDQGKRLFAHLAEAGAAGADGFVEVFRRQHAMPEVLVPVLTRFAYDEESDLARLVRLDEEGEVVADPARRFGKPIVESCGMFTSLLADAWRANGRDAAAVADWYGVAAEEVDRAVAFDEGFTGLAA